jgi:predicted metalloprotease with PDZ domain
LPRGLPEAGDRGLDRTHTHGRIYWGGCLYWFLADIEIRKRTDGRKSLDDAIRAILDDGGDGSADWPIDRVIATGDRATGTTVLKELHDRMGDKPDKPDLDALWRDLGVVYRQGKVTFDDKAPLAAIREAMTKRTPEPATQPADR